jgi:membrane protein DedA with SNARE-associated domain
VALTVAGCAIWSLGFELAGVAAGAGWARLGPRIANALLAATLVGLAAFLCVRARRRGIG